MESGSAPDVDARIRGMQIVAGALIAGLLPLTVIMAMVAMGNDPGSPLVAYIGIGLAVLNAGLAAVVPGTVAQAGLPEVEGYEGETERTKGLYALYQKRMIVGMALLEGAAVFNAIAYVISVRWWNLAAVGALIAVMVAAFPTRSKVVGWVEAQQESLGTRR